MRHPLPLTLGQLRLAERVVGVVGGGVLAALAIVIALSSAGLAALVWTGVALAGIDFVITGFRGSRPLAARLLRDHSR